MAERVPQPQIKRILMNKAALKRMPISGTFEVTPLCNMNCRMCYIRMSEKEMNERGTMLSAQEWIEFGKEAAAQGMLFLLLTGGEPFLRRDFRYIYEELTKLGLSITINSNATLIDENIMEWLSQNPPTKVNVTLYGKDNATYERLCGLKNGYDRAVRGIELLKAAGIMVNINASFTKYNEDDMEHIINFAKERELTIKTSAYMFPPVRNAKNGQPDNEVRFTPQEAAAARAKSDKIRLGENYKMYLKAVHAGNCVPEEDDDCVRSEDAKMKCMAGKSSFWVTWDGRITPCGMMNAPVINHCRDGKSFKNEWDYIVSETDRIRTPVECENCSKKFACLVCGALTTAEGDGDSNKKPEYLCRMTEHYLELMEKEYSEIEKESE